MGWNQLRETLTSTVASLVPGEWILAVRLLSGSQEAALIPVLRFELAASGDHTYEVYEGSLNAMLLP